MRVLLSTLVSIGLLASQAAQAESCMRPPERVAFEVAGLKSQLMVTAITCKMEERYNAFVMRFRPDLVRQERALSGYFDRSFGRHGTQEHDDYITSLANSQSQTGIRQGSAFCQQNTGLFDEVMALKTASDLPTLAAGKTLSQPLILVECTTTPARASIRTAMATTKR